MIDAKTKICCIIGDPVEHSLSPAMHNAGYEALGLNFAYLAFQVKDVKNAITGIRALGIRGASITVPHKITAMQYLDEIDETAQYIGAVNTIVNSNGKLKGYNTDYTGAISALEEKTNPKDKRVVIIGAGGAARAIAFGLQQKQARITILNRTKENAKTLANNISGDYGDLSKIALIQNADILINATTPGETLVPKKYLHKNLVVFDVVYNPKETLFLKQAKSKRCKIVYGYKMLLYQAVSQFELFTERKAPIAIMEEVLLKCLDF